MTMRMDLFKEMLSFDSTSGRERDFSLWLERTLESDRVEAQEAGDGTLNLLFSWGKPRVVFCTHVDTVPPYIPPRFEDAAVKGRGSCDAKGQIFSMYTACRRLADSGRSDFGLLLLSGEETGSFGAKAFAKTGFRAPYLVVGEPTGNQMVSACKGTKSFDLRFRGRASHSGYPEAGDSAVERFVSFMNALSSNDFGIDPLLGKTTFNVGLLKSDNPQNILSPLLECRLYFRTTFLSDEEVCRYMSEAACDSLEVTARGGDSPASYIVVPGIPCAPAAFGSDAPHLSNFEKKMICGPGSILTAHRDNEEVAVSELERAVEIYMKIYESCN